jgi:hypothetical protein
VENTGYTFAPVKYLRALVASTPTSCQMKRPAKTMTHHAGGGRESPAGVVFALERRAWSFSPSLLNGVSYGLLLFMLSSGLTLIFSMMGVLNFAHASFYMLGAYLAYRSRASSASGPRCHGAAAGGPAGRAVRALCLRRVHKFGHVPSCWSPSACPT